jgi:GH25 family lysozyme M1 (1,4-beta-N-acetylmuramidase)
MIQGIDTSAHTDNPKTLLTVDWQKCKAAGCRFVIMRATLGLLFQDTVYKLHSEALKGVLPRGSYHYYRTGSSVEEQVNYYYNFAGRLEIPPVMDLEDWYKELPKGQELIQIAETFLDALDQKFGQESILYTSPNIIKYYMGLPAGHPLTKRKLWIAHYGVVKPEIKPWTNYILHQYSETVDDKGRDGTFYGFNESKAVDMNNFNGTEEDFAMFTGGVIPDPKPVENDGLRLYANCEMNIRTGPGISYSKVGKIAAGTVVTPLDVTGAEVWVKIDRGWVCKKQGNTNYLEAI